MATKFTPLHDRILVRRVEEAAPLAAESSFRTPPKISRRRAKSSPSAKARPTKKAKFSPRGERRRPHSVRQVFRHRDQD